MAANFLILLNENIWISIAISLKFVPKGPINNIPALVQTMAWRRPGDKPLSEPMMISLLTHICVTRAQWVQIALGNVTSVHAIYNFSITGSYSWIENDKLYIINNNSHACKHQCQTRDASEFYDIHNCQKKNIASQISALRLWHLDISDSIKTLTFVKLF